VGAASAATISLAGRGGELVCERTGFWIRHSSPSRLRGPARREVGSLAVATGARAGAAQAAANAQRAGRRAAAGAIRTNPRTAIRFRSARRPHYGLASARAAPTAPRATRRTVYARGSSSGARAHAVIAHAEQHNALARMAIRFVRRNNVRSSTCLCSSPEAICRHHRWRRSTPPSGTARRNIRLSLRMPDPAERTCIRRRGNCRRSSHSSTRVCPVMEQAHVPLSN
jgi:hypothetical protein